MRDYFGQDSAPSESATTDVPMPAAPAPATGPAPTLAQAVDKAVAKADADQAVAADPHAVHHVKLAAAAPTVLGSTATGAGIGFLILGPPGALVGGGAGWIIERYQIGGGPFGKGWNKLKGHLHHRKAAAAAATAAVTAPAPAATAPTAGQ